jgi:hypothetical protein
MGDFDNIGELMHLPLESIELESESFVPNLMINEGAEAITKSQGRNWVPVIVQETEMYSYQVVANKLVYLAAKKADLERVWCIVISPETENIEQAKLLTLETLPKINLCTADQATILSALEYLSNQEGNPLKRVNINNAASKIANANRKEWNNLNPITKLGCGIVNDKKIKVLKKIFYLEKPPFPKPVSLQSATREEIYERLNYFKEYNKEFKQVNVEKATQSIFEDDKKSWKDLKPITEFKCGIGKAKIPTLEKVFTI